MKIKQLFRATFCGGLTGFVNGIFGGGGGMIAVPLLKDELRYSEKQAHATAIAIIAPVCAVSAITYMVSGYAVIEQIIPVSVGSIFGGILGAYLLDKLPRIIIKILFVIVMSAAGVRMIIG
jgi:hypothetical protein